MIALLEPILLLAGLILIVTGLLLYGMRTQDWRSLRVFWRPTVAFQAREYFLYKLGITVMVIGLFARLYNHLGFA
ncbi:hypothetical protein QCD60_09915 [Pokkaliibacter sp. MBI-7]|uniref:hypothetical protein n=1 Tax=Pokkaliibacter sp. MBI-7 TaxID=3040600 RepID=UPI002449E225|nr:hypothetical protein [Pokkaliibacter sp. MBI-7]MDH2432880.1 hypothetical protein [Pokkaliibacter sp. MBI-7]